MLLSFQVMMVILSSEDVTCNFLCCGFLIRSYVIFKICKYVVEEAQFTYELSNVTSSNGF